MELIGFTWVLREKGAITQVNDNNDFEASKLGATHSSGCLFWAPSYNLF